MLEPLSSTKTQNLLAAYSQMNWGQSSSSGMSPGLGLWLLSLTPYAVQIHP